MREKRVASLFSAVASDIDRDWYGTEVAKYPALQSKLVGILRREIVAEEAAKKY